VAIQTDLQTFTSNLHHLFDNGILPIAASRNRGYKRGEQGLEALQAFIRALNSLEEALRNDSPPQGSEKEMRMRLDTEYINNPLFFVKVEFSEKGFFHKNEVLRAEKMNTEESLKMMAKRRLY
jgi:hypothetical protein